MRIILVHKERVLFMKSELARRLSALRMRSGLSQKEVADRVNISAQSCSHYETGWRTPDIHALYRLSQAYNVTPEYLLGYSDQQSKSRPSYDLSAFSLNQLDKLNTQIEYISSMDVSPLPQESSLNSVSFPDLSLGKRLRAFRKYAELSQADVAQALGITIQAYSHYETERRTPSPEIFYQLAQVYHVSMNHLFTGEPDLLSIINDKISRLSPAKKEEFNHFIQHLKNRV